MLENLCTFEGVLGAFLIDKNGEILAKFCNEELDFAYVIKIIQCCEKSGKEIGEALVGSPLRQSYVEFSDSSLTFDTLKNGNVLALLAMSGANIGRIRHEVRKTRKELEQVMS